MIKLKKAKEILKNIIPLLFILTAFSIGHYKEYSFFLTLIGGVLVVLFLFLYSEKK